MKIGVIGGGQLGQMLALAAYPLGMEVICYERDPDCPAALVTEVVVGSYDDGEKLRAFANKVDVITYEFENVPVSSLQLLIENESTDIYPPLPALAVSQDRLAEKDFFTKVDVPTTKYIAVNSFSELQAAVAQIGLPAVLKTRRMGYDGKGQCVLRTVADVELAWTKLQGQELLLENFLAFEREVSCIAVRSIKGEIEFYPLVENHHHEGILRVSEALIAEDKMTQLAQKYVTRVLQELNYVGVLAIEFFQKDRKLIANEMAPRVHNSGHWTIEGAQTSQFENHLRAIAGLPLGMTKAVTRTAMVNFISDLPELASVLKIPGTHFHTYGKQARPGRKLGHVTLCLHEEKPYTENLKQLMGLVCN